MEGRRRREGEADEERRGEVKRGEEGRGEERKAEEVGLGQKHG